LDDEINITAIRKTLARITPELNFFELKPIAEKLFHNFENVSKPLDFIKTHLLPLEHIQLYYAVASVLYHDTQSSWTVESDQNLPEAFAVALREQNLQVARGNEKKEGMKKNFRKWIMDLHPYLSGFLMRQYNFIKFILKSEYHAKYIQQLSADELKKTAIKQVKDIVNNFHKYYDTHLLVFEQTKKNLMLVKKEVEKFIKHCNKSPLYQDNKTLLLIKNFLSELDVGNKKFDVSEYNDLVNMCDKLFSGNWVGFHHHSSKVDQFCHIFSQSLLATQPDKFLKISQKLQKLNAEFLNIESNENLDFHDINHSEYYEYKY
jgi:hypothetical protein